MTPKLLELGVVTNRAASAPFDVLISDVVMEGMSGIEAAIEIRKLLPNCKVLLMSGNNRTFDMLEYAHEREHDFDILAKPFHPTVIIDMLNAMSVLNSSYAAVPLVASSCTPTNDVSARWTLSFIHEV